MSFGNPLEIGPPLEVKEEGVTLVSAVKSIDFAGDGVTGAAVGKAVTETIPGAGAVPVKCTGAEIDTGTNDTKFATPKALADQTVLAKTNAVVKLDQTTPQTISGGRPITNEGIQLGTAPTVGAHSEGKVFYDATFHTPACELGDSVTLQIGQETMCYVKNDTVAAILNGDVVYISGAASGIPTIALAKGDAESTSFVLGVVTSTPSIAAGGFGYVTIRGHVNDLDTSAWNVNDLLYLSADTAGKLTNVQPSGGSYDVKVARVMIKDGAAGRIFVNVRQPFKLNDLSDVDAASPTVDYVLKWNGTEWVPSPGVTVSGSAGIEFYNCTPVINSRTSPAGLTADGTSGNGIAVNSLSKTPVTTAEQTIVGQAVNDTRAYVAWLYNTALGRTTIDAGTWDFTTFAAVNSITGGRVTTNTRQVYQVQVPASGTVSVTGAGANVRTVNASAGTPFAATGYFAASATNTTASYIRMPSGIYQILTRVSDTEVTIAVPTGYSNESTVAYSVWNKLFGSTSAPITSTGTNYAQYDQSSVQGAFTIAATDKLGQIGFVTSNNTTSLTVAYNGTTHSTHFQTPLVTLHNNLAGLQGGTSNEYYHVTAAEKTVVANTSGTNTGDETAARIGAIINGATADATPLDADKFGFWDVVDAALKSCTWANVKSVLKTYFDSLYFSLAGVNLMAEQATIELDPAGSADEKYCGITIAGIAGATLAVGDLVYLAVADGRWELADANAAATAGDVPLGLCVLAAANDGDATKLLLIGTIRSAAFPASIANGAPVYVSTTAGDIQAAQPTGVDDVIRRVGWAISAEPNTIYFNPSNDYVTHVA